MDIVYVLGKGSTWLDNELKYSLRSLSNVKDKIGKVWIIGEKPGFLRNVKHISCPDIYTHKSQNALSKILLACDQRFLTREFLLMNDDFYFLKAQTVKNRARKSLPETLNAYRKNHISSKYVEAMENTVKFLRDGGCSLIDHEVHYPMIVSKTEFREVFKNINWKSEPLLYRSVYGNIAQIQPVFIKKDLKAYNDDDFATIKSKKFLSSDNSLVASADFRDWLEYLFPEPSLWEDPDYRYVNTSDFADPASSGFVFFLYSPANINSRGMVDGKVVCPGEIVRMTLKEYNSKANKRDYQKVS